MNKTLLVLAAFLSTSLAFGWGDTGHRITGELAQKRLNRKARNAIKEIAGTESLARAATWPDEMRSSPNQEYFSKTYPWHYIELPDGASLDGFAPPQGDVMNATKKMAKILQDAKATKDQKLEALRFLAHFVGDLHQPLHVGNGKDQGGNFCMVQFFGEKINLHSLWDSGLIGKTNLSFTEYARFLTEMTSEEQVRAWSGGKIEEWIEESRKVRDSIYPVSKDPAAPRNYCKSQSSDVIADEVMPRLSYDYAFVSRPVLDQRLMQGGLRLGYLLNAIFSGDLTAWNSSGGTKKGPTPASTK